MGSVIKHRRGPIGNTKDALTHRGEILVSSGSIGDLSGPFLHIGNPSMVTDGTVGASVPVSKIYTGANPPTITVLSHGNVLDGTPFYSTNEKALYRLAADSNVRLDLSGNISGSTINVASITGSLLGTASYATSADVAISASYATNASTSITASYSTVAVSASHANSADTAITASYAVNVENVFPYTGSAEFFGSIVLDGAITASSGLITGDVTVEGKVTAQEFHTEFVSSSIIYQSGSTKFGDTADDVHSFTGSIAVTQGGFSGSLLGNASTATSASHAVTSNTSITASYIDGGTY